MIKNFLYFFIFLLSGCSQLFANANQDCIQNSVAKNSLITEQTRGTFTENGSVLKFKSILSSADVKHTRIVSMEDLDEIDDDKLSFHKKHVEITKCFVSSFFIRTFEHFYSYRKTSFPFWENLSIYSSSKYLTFRVLRI